MKNIGKQMSCTDSYVSDKTYYWSQCPKGVVSYDQNGPIKYELGTRFILGQEYTKLVSTALTKKYEENLVKAKQVPYYN